MLLLLTPLWQIFGLCFLCFVRCLYLQIHLFGHRLLRHVGVGHLLRGRLHLFGHLLPRHVCLCLELLYLDRLYLDRLDRVDRLV